MPCAPGPRHTDIITETCSNLHSDVRLSADNKSKEIV